MSDNNRTTLNVHKDHRDKARDVKQEYDETWGDVLAFYAEFREHLTIDATAEE